MLTQKLYKNGHSVAVTIPKEYLNDLNLRDGSEVIVEQDPEAEAIIISRKKSRKSSTKISPEFLKWLDSFNKKYAPALKELARR
jgi:antitoxin component of MazEF toxin-antitoxin module